MSRFQALVDEHLQESNPSSTRNRIKLVGAAGQTPQVWVGDVVSLHLSRTAAGELAPSVTSNDQDQSFNALVAEVSNALPVDGTTVIFVVDGYSQGLPVFPGDSLSVELQRLAAGPGAPGV